MLMLSNEVIMNPGNLFDEVVVESEGKVFIDDARGHRWVFSSAKKVITYFIDLFVVQRVLSNRYEKEIPFSFV